MLPRLVFAASCLCMAMHAHANLLTNGGAERGTLAGWTVGGFSNPRVDDGGFDPGIDPRSGQYMFHGGVGPWGTLTQNVALTGLGQSRQLAVSFWEQGLDQDNPSDNGFVSLTYYAGDGRMLGLQTTGVIDSHDGVWTRYRGSFDVPLDAVSVDYTMNFVRNFGIDLDAFFDDNALTLTTNVPEPAGSWLAVIGLCAMAAFARRRRAR